jgi:ABC-2 type transport system permease protein
MTLYRMALRQQLVSWLIWVLVIVLGVATVVSAAPAVADSRALVTLLGGLPASMRALMGGPLMVERPVDGYLYVKLVMYLPLLVGIFAGFQASSLLAREMDHRRFDFLLGLPLTRRQLLLARLGALITSQAAMWLVTVLALILFMRQQGLHPDVAGYLLVAYSGFLVTLVTSTGAVWASAGARDYGVAARWGLGIAAVPFVYDLAVRIATASKAWRYILPYGYYDPPHLLLTHEFPWASTLVLVAAAAVLTYGAVHAFERREV